MRCEICGIDLVSEFSARTDFRRICDEHFAYPHNRCQWEAVYWPDDEHVRVQCALIAGHAGSHRDADGDDEADHWTRPPG